MHNSSAPGGGRGGPGAGGAPGAGAVPPRQIPHYPPPPPPPARCLNFFQCLDAYIIQEAKMTPKDRCKTWCGHTASWHSEQVGPELQSVLQANHPQHAGGLQREQRFHRTGCPGAVEEAYQTTPGALCTACRCMGALFEILNDTEKLACNFYFSTVSPDNQTGAGMPPRNPGLRPNPGTTPPLPSMRPHPAAGT
jgi:hypothetical protein